MSKINWPEIKEYAQLMALNLFVRFKNLNEYMKVMFNFYGNPAFAKADSYLTLSYLFKNPFQISKRFLMDKGECELQPYGETPLTTLELIADESRLSISDTIYELGCGRGRSCFWLNQFIGAKVVGVEQVPEFVQRAKEVAEKFNVKGLEFRNEDMLKCDLKDATAVYIYGTGYPAEFINRLARHLEKLPRGAKVISVSYPISEYAPKVAFEVMKRFPARFTWGTTDVYIQQRI